MGDGKRRGIGSIGGRGWLLKTQDLGDHLAHGLLVGLAGTRHRGLDLSGGVQRNGDIATCRGNNHHARGLRGTHHRADVELAENPLKCDDIGFVLIEPRINAIGNGQQPLVKWRSRLGADDCHIDERGTPVGFDVNHGQAATGQTGVDTNHSQSQEVLGLFEFCHDLGADVGVRVDVLDVVELLKCLG